MHRKYNFDDFDDVVEVEDPSPLEPVYQLYSEPPGPSKLNVIAFKSFVIDELKAVLGRYAVRKKEMGTTDTYWLRCTIGELFRVLYARGLVLGSEGIGYTLHISDDVVATQIQVMYRPCIQMGVFCISMGV
jgi:hypothetical protein